MDKAVANSAEADTMVSSCTPGNTRKDRLVERPGLTGISVTVEADTVTARCSETRDGEYVIAVCHGASNTDVARCTCRDLGDTLRVHAL